VTNWEYSPAPESTDIVSLADTYGLFIGGEFVDPASGEYFKTINPASEEVLLTVAGRIGVTNGDGLARLDRAASKLGSSRRFSSPA
jgi:aldehyde dehydrogenase (NAD+)